MQTVKDAIHSIITNLVPVVGQNEARHFAWLIFDYLKGYSRTDLILKEQERLDLSEIEFIEKTVARLKLGEPLQYVLGQTEFMGLPFKVDRRVLIPRPETEELVEWILSETENEAVHILDIGTGSGCIPIALKKRLPNAYVEAWDISADALSLAGNNALLNKTPVVFKQNDVLNTTADQSPCFDVVVSNPPYVTETEKCDMASNVLDYEPHLALFVPNHAPLIFYAAIARLSKQLLKPGGNLYFEINQAFRVQTSDLLRDEGYTEIVLRTDLSGRDRMIKATWPGVPQ